jgi:hypothetical protein
MAEHTQEQGVYNYVHNNPISLIDPDGMLAGNPFDVAERKEKQEERNRERDMQIGYLYYIHIGPNEGHSMGANGCIEISGGREKWVEFNDNIRRLSGESKLIYSKKYNNIMVRFLMATQPALIDSGKTIKK